MDNKDIQELYNIPFEIDIYDEHNFNELLWNINKCLLDGSESRELKFTFKDGSLECWIGHIGYGMSTKGSYKEAIVSLVLGLAFELQHDENDDLNMETFRKIMTITDWKRK